MKCLILAAGYATRLYPLTENFPKPLLKVGEKTILDWLADDIAPAVDGFVVVTNHKFAEHFRDWARTRGGAQPVAVVDDGTASDATRLGAVRDIDFAVRETGIDDDLLVVAGDNVLDFSLQRFIAYARGKGTSCIMRFREPDAAKLTRCGVVETAGEEAADPDLVLRMEEKPAQPRSHWVCPPFYYFTRADLARLAAGLAAGCGTDAPGSYIAWLCTQAPVHAMPMPGRRYDIGNLESYREVQATYRGIV